MAATHVPATGYSSTAVPSQPILSSNVAAPAFPPTVIATVHSATSFPAAPAAVACSAAAFAATLCRCVVATNLQKGDRKGEVCHSASCIEMSQLVRALRLARAGTAASAAVATAAAAASIASHPAASSIAAH